jgi:hypothetical protein
MEYFMTKLKAVGLFLAAPFIGLAYAVMLPFFGIYLFINVGTEAALKKAAEQLPKDNLTETIKL